MGVLRKFGFGVLSLAFLVLAGMCSPNEVSASLGACPASVSFLHSDIALRSNPTSVGVSMSSSLGITRVHFSFGDGQSAVASTYLVGFETRASVSYTYSGWGDYIVSVALGDDEAYLYECASVISIQVYDAYVVSFPGLSSFPGSDYWEFDVDTGLPAGILAAFPDPKVIGAVGRYSYNISGVGGRGSSPLDEVDYRWVTGEDSVTPSSPAWVTIPYAADQNINDSNANYWYSGPFNVHERYYISGARQSNYVSFEIRAPNQTWLNGAVVGVPVPTVDSFHITSSDLGFSGVDVVVLYWRYGSVGGSEPPPQYSNWRFVAHVVDEGVPAVDSCVGLSDADCPGVDGAVLKLIGSPNGVYGDGDDVDLGTSCTSVKRGPNPSYPEEPGYCYLFYPTVYDYFFIETSFLPEGYDSVSTECSWDYTSRPPQAGTCGVVSASVMSQGDFDGSIASAGTYTGNVFKVGYYQGPWWQVEDADVITSGSGVGMDSQLPTGETFDLDGDGGYPGVVVYQDDPDPAWGTGDLSSTDWLAQSGTVGLSKYDYSFFEVRSPQVDCASVADPSTEFCYNNMPNGLYWSGALMSLIDTSKRTIDGRKWFKRTGNLSLRGNINLANRDVLLFVSGNLDFGRNPDLVGRVYFNDKSGYFAAFVGGNIQVSASTVGGGNPGLEGVYFANGTFDTGSWVTSDDAQLPVEGVVVAQGGINLARDLGSEDNEDTPAELFKYVPGLLFKIPPELLGKGVVWREVRN